MRHFWAIVSMDPYCCLCIHIPHYPHPSPDPNHIPNPKSYNNLKLFNELAPIPTTQYVRQLNDVKATRPISSSVYELWPSVECADMSVRAILTITFTHYNGAVLPNNIINTNTKHNPNR